MQTMIQNASRYGWAEWGIGIMRSFLSGGAAAFVTGGGGAIAGITAKQQYIMMGTTFVGMGLYRLGEFLKLHGAPDPIQVASVKTTTEVTPIDESAPITKTVTTTPVMGPEKKGE